MSAGAPLPPSPLELGLQALREGRPGDALHAFEQAYHINPHDYRLHEACGELYFEQGDMKRAREYLQYAIHLTPNAAGPRYRLALVALQQGRTQEAMQHLQNVLALDPNHEEARRALVAEQERSRIAARLPVWLADRRFGQEAILHPPRQVGPDGKDRPAPLRAPYHCVNCYFRAGQRPDRMYAYRYQWWNLGLVGLVFGGWPLYLIWTMLARERRFSLEPLYCATCSSHRRLLATVCWVLVVVGSIFGVSGIAALATWQSQPASQGLLIFSLTMTVLALGCGGSAAWSFRAGVSQRGVRMRVLSEEEVGVSFCSGQYASAFEALNGAFVVDRAGPDARAEAESFVPAVVEEPAGAEPAAAPPTPSHQLPPASPPTG